MNFTNLKNKIYILLFLGILVFPWICGGFLRIIAKDYYNQISIVETEKRDLQQIEWSNLLNSGESISGYIDDHIPFRYTFISWYKGLNDKIDDVYQVAVDSIGQKFYSASTEATAYSVISQVETDVIGIIQGEEAAKAAAAQAAAEAEAANYYPLHTYQDVIIGREGWLFLYGENEYECYTGTNILSEEQMANYANTLNELQSICNAQGKDLYIYIAPNKSQVYSQYMPTVEISDTYKRDSRLHAYMQENSTATFLYPLTEMMASTNSYQTYYKYDSHWNHLGGLYGVNALYAAMGLEQTDTTQWITGTQDADKYELYTYMGIPDSQVTHDDTECSVAYRPDITVTGLDDPEAMIVHTTSNGVNDRKLCLIGDSFRVNMEAYLSADFTSCTFCHRDYMSEIHSDIKDADIIVIEAVERYDYEAFTTAQRVINVLSN